MKVQRQLCWLLGLSITQKDSNGYISLLYKNGCKSWTTVNNVFYSVLLWLSSQTAIISIYGLSYTSDATPETIMSNFSNIQCTNSPLPPTSIGRLWRYNSDVNGIRHRNRRGFVWNLKYPVLQTKMIMLYMNELHFAFDEKAKPIFTPISPLSKTY